MKRTSSSPATGIAAGSDNHSDKKQRPVQDNGPATTAMPTIAEKTITEAISAAAASNETTRGATPAVSNDTGYVSDSLQPDSDDDSSISDSLQWPPEDDEERLSDQDHQSYLCSRCRQIDFDEIFSRHSLARGGDPILSLYDEPRVLRDPECAFCQAMHFIHPSLDTWELWWRTSHSLVAATVKDLKGYKSDKPVHAEGRILLSLSHQTNPYERIHRWTRDEADRGLKTTDDDLVGYLAEEQTIDSDYEALPATCVHSYVDLDLIKRKLDVCRTFHSRCRNERPGDEKVVQGMRLIDCKARIIVPAHKRGCTYAALSYVWGTSENTLESRPVSNNSLEELPADLPKTIADAMLVSLKLKIRYLWCDRYCIRQDPRNKEEMDEKHGQIARMCEIYRRASITIIAAAGDGPDYGLPGVSKKRQSPRVHIGSRTLFATFPDPRTSIDGSKWSTRGWTFQEGLLARRRLVFTDQQVYFQCGETGVFEASDKSGAEMSISIDPDLAKYNPLYPYFSMEERGFPSIWPRINSYAELTLGNTQDILNAFLGVLKYYEEVAFPYRDAQARNVAGLLIAKGRYDSRSWPSALSLALAWECDVPGKRRDGFPSWSWIGWYCKGFARNEDRDHLPENRTSSLSLSIEGPNNELVEHGKLHELIEARYDFSEARYLHVTAPSLEARVIPEGAITEYIFSWIPPLWDFDNNEDMLLVRYLGSEKFASINLSDKRFLDASLPCEGFQCFGIVLDEDHTDIPNDHLGEYKENSLGVLVHAITLLVVERGGGFERIGVSYVDRQELRQISSTVREFRLM